MVLSIGSSHFPLRRVAACLGCLVYSASALAQAYDGSLIDAVRLTLERGSSIAISKQVVLLTQANVLSAQGAFDPTFYAGAGFCILALLALIRK